MDAKFVVEVTHWTPEPGHPDSFVDRCEAVETFATWNDAVAFARTWRGQHQAQIYPILGVSPDPVTGEPSPNFGPELEFDGGSQ
jgi:hypothetical protein